MSAFLTKYIPTETAISETRTLTVINSFKKIKLSIVPKIGIKQDT